MIERITCFRCQKRGHFADMCPNTEVGASHNIIAREVNNVEPDEDKDMEGVRADD